MGAKPRKKGGGNFFGKRDRNKVKERRWGKLRKRESSGRWKKRTKLRNVEKEKAEKNRGRKKQRKERNQKE